MISAGDPAPSQTTSAKRSVSSSYAAYAAAARWARPVAYSPASSVPAGRPRSTTWLRRSDPGLSSTGFIADSGGTRAAWAWRNWARPISAPSAHTPELLDMFWALNGATATPRRAKSRQSPVTTSDLPASEEVPATSRPVARPSVSTG